MTSSFAGDPPSFPGAWPVSTATDQPRPDPLNSTQDDVPGGSAAAPGIGAATNAAPGRDGGEDVVGGGSACKTAGAGTATDVGAGSERYYAIGELASAYGVTTRAIRFYETKKLITPVRKGTARLYSRRDRARLQMILRGKNLGFSLEEIREFLDLYDADPAQTVQTKHLLGKVDVAITELEDKRADIERTLSELAQIRKECLDHLEGET